MKSELRKKYKKLRDDFKYNRTTSKTISDKFLNLQEYKECKSIFIFYSFGSEIYTIDIIKQALSDGKTVALPYMTKNPHEMFFIMIKDLSELVKNKIGIYEPVYNKDNIVVSDKETIIIVPGLVFSNDKYRIGYGGGYYDKYLSENKYLKSIGLAFDFQITDEIPKDKYDIQTDIIITDRRIIE